ncbi:hypothetical protein HY004_02455 [Candidatus Saccharibacteria bacterium]|nr:hypothetical protein [Candidatus Saccharibacteria bacterium]
MIKKYAYIFVLAVAFFSFVFTPLTPAAYAAASTTRVTGLDCPGQEGMFGVRAWYFNLCNGDGNVSVGTHPEEFIAQLAVNLLSIVLMVCGYIAVGFVIWGGLMYIIAAGDAGKLAKAKTTIQNALTGLLIALSAVAISTLIQTNI